MRLDGDRLHVQGRDGAITTGGATVELAPLTDRLRAAVAGGKVYLVGIPHPVVGQVLGCAVTRPDDVERLRAGHSAISARPSVRGLGQWSNSHP